MIVALLTEFAKIYTLIYNFGKYKESAGSYQERNCEGEAGARTCTEEGGKKERMLEGEGGEQERKCGGESADGGRSWEETERTAQKAVERSF